MLGSCEPDREIPEACSAQRLLAYLVVVLFYSDLFERCVSKL